MAAAKGELLPITRRCKALGVNRTSVYTRPKGVSMAKAAFDERVMSRIDYRHTRHPATGTRQLSKIICEQDELPVGHKLIRRLMGLMGFSEDSEFLGGRILLRH